MKNAENAVKYNSFDIAKLICSILVVMIHIAPFGKQTEANIFSCLNFGFAQYLCRIAVPLFFIFNGFFLRKKMNLEDVPGQYNKKYFTHILKLYLIWSLIYFPINLGEIFSSTEGVKYRLVFYVRDLFFSGSYTHLWYLNALLFAVLLVSFLMFKKYSPTKILCISAPFYIIGLFGDAYYGLIAPLYRIPLLEKLLNTYFLLFGTTRNGLFFAFFFIALGMVLADKEFSIGRKKSLTIFAISMILLFAEVVLLTKFSISKDRNLFIFTVPASLSLFLFLKTLDLKDFKINIRRISSLIFYSHLLILAIVSGLLKIWGISLLGTPLLFIIVLIVTILFAVTIMSLSDKKYFRWLKHFY